MANGIRNRVGPYLYADGAAGERSFRGHVFRIVIAGAYDAGIIGPEHNGIVVLDEDNLAVALDQHFLEPSGGYFGPSQRQWAEFQRIMAMDWGEFSRFVREHPRFRKGSVPDIADPDPMTVRPKPDRIIFPASKREDVGAFEYPLESRREIEQFVVGHPVHRVDGPYSPWAFAWDVKVRGFDGGGRVDGFSPDPAMDDRWNAYVERNDDLFWQAAQDGLSRFVEGEFSTYPGKDQGRYGFATTGRSGGWLILTRMDGIGEGRVPTWGNQGELKAWVADLDDASLIDLYKLLVQVDQATRDPGAEMAFQFACMRASMEETWAQEVQEAARPG